MSILAIIFLAVSFLLALAVSWAILLPFFETETTVGHASPIGELLMKKEALLDALEDLEQDYHAAKLGETDYEDAKRELTSQAGEVFSKIDSGKDV